jgi:hypothetical protein
MHSEVRRRVLHDNTISWIWCITLIVLRHEHGFFDRDWGQIVQAYAPFDHSTLSGFRRRCFTCGPTGVASGKVRSG